MSQGMSLGDCVYARECACAHTGLGLYSPKLAGSGCGGVVSRGGDAKQGGREKVEERSLKSRAWLYPTY